MLDSVAAAQVNDGLERIRRQVAGLEESVRILDSNGAEAALKQSEWARAVVALDNEHLRLYLRATDSLQEDAARHQLVLERLRQQNEQNEKQAEGDLAELAEIQESIAELRKTLAALPTKQLHQKRTIDEARMRLEKHLKKLERISAEGRRAETKIYNSVALYERALSLKIDVTSDAQSLENGGQLSQSATGMSQSCKTIFFRFSNINPKHLDQEFVVSIRRDEKTGNRFRANTCTPYVAEFETLAHAFYTSQDVHALLKAVRRGFREIVQT